MQKALNNIKVLNMQMIMIIFLIQMIHKQITDHLTLLASDKKPCGNLVGSEMQNS